MKQMFASGNREKLYTVIKPDPQAGLIWKAEIFTQALGPVAKVFCWEISALPAHSSGDCKLVKLTSSVPAPQKGHEFSKEEAMLAMMEALDGLDLIGDIDLSDDEGDDPAGAIGWK